MKKILPGLAQTRSTKPNPRYKKVCGDLLTHKKTKILRFSELSMPPLFIITSETCQEVSSTHVLRNVHQNELYSKIVHKLLATKFTI